MLYDANASIGNWPFRAHRTRTAEQLLARFDEVGIDRGLVASLSAVCYRDCQAGNEELLAAIEPHRDRLTPTAVLNPCYAGWERDLAACHEDHGCRGVRLYPNYHRYDLMGAEGRRILGACAERGLPACFVCRHEDRRQRHWLDVVDDLALPEILAGLRPIPAARFLILEGIGLEGSELIGDPTWREREFGIDLSRLATVLQGSIPKLIDVLGHERIVFGTGLPLKGPNSALLKLRLLDASDEVRAAIGGGNLRRLVGDGR